MPRFSFAQYARELFRGVYRTSKSRRSKRALLNRGPQANVQIVAAEILESRALLSAVPVPSGLVAWWSGNNTGADVTGNNNGVLYGTTFAPGEVGQALSFDGTNDHLAVPDNPDLALTSSLTIEGWVNVKAFPSAGIGTGMIFYRGDNNSNLAPIVLGDNSNGQIGFVINSGHGLVNINAAVTANQWVYVAATLDASTGAMSLYLNGTLAAQTTTPFTPYAALDPTQDPGVGIGNSNGIPGDPNSFPFDGLIDELSVYNVALTQAQIQGIYNAGSAGKIEPAVATGVTSVVATGPGISAGTGDVGIGHAVTLTVNFNNTVTVDTTGGSPTLSLNDGATATYTGGSGTTALTFLYTVSPGQSIDDLTVAGMNLNGATIKNGSTNANLNNADTNPAGILQVDTTRPTVLSINRNTYVNAGTTSVSFTVTFSKPVTGVGPGDFHTATSGTVADTSIQVTPVSGTVYTVTVGGISGSGTLGLNLVNNGSILDLAGNPLGPTGLFQPAVTFAVGNNPSWIASADLNGDGFQDLVVANSGDNDISVLLGNGDGTFKAPQTYATSGAPTSVAIADLTGNGKLDLVVTENGAVNVFLGNGNGTFQPEQSFGTGFTTSSVKIADLNGDGKPDLVLTYGTGYGNDFVGVLLGNGNGTFQPGQTYATGVFSNQITPSGVGGSAVSVAIADLTGNGKLDLVVADGDSADPLFGNSVPAQISVLMGNGNGTFQAEQTYSLGSDMINPNSVAVADLNGDGKPDVVVSSATAYNGGNGPGNLTVLLNNGSGAFPTATNYSTGNDPTSVTVADVNQDGKLDLIDANAGDGTVTILFGNGNGTFQGNQQVFSVGGGDSSLTVASFTSDGAPDIAVQNGSLLLNDITGNFTGQIYTIVPPSQVYEVKAAGTETRVNTYTTDTQSRPVVAMDSAGDYVAVWQSSGEDGSSWGIYGQLYHANGTPNGNQFLVNVTTGGPQDLPSVAMDPAGDFVVTWQSKPTGTPDGYDVYARQFNASGVAQGNEFLVNQFLTSNQWRPAVAMDQAGDFVITWVSYSQYMPGDVSTYARRYNAAGVAQGNEFRVATSGDVFPSIGMDAAGTFVIDYGAQAELFNASGAALAAVDTSSVAANGTVAMDASGDFVIVADRVYGGYHGQYRYVAQRYDANGVALGNLILGPIAGQGINQIFYRVAMDNAGDFVVTYESYGDDGSADAVLAQPYNAAGLTFGSQFLVNTYTASNQSEPVIAMDANGDFVIAWSSSPSQDGSSYGIYSQRYSVIANQAPSGTSGTITTLENTPYTFKVSDFGFTDPNNPPNALMAVEFTTLPNAGVLTDNGTPLTAGQFVSAADINAGKLVFTPNTNLLGGPYFVAKFEVQNNGGTAHGGHDTDANPKVLDVQITKINHAPVGTSGTVTTPVNTAYVFKTADFGFTDPNDSPPNSLLAVKITLLPNAGTLSDNGAPVTVNQFVSAADISAGKFIFTPNSNLTGGPFFLFKFQVQDNGGTAGGGMDLDPTPKVLDITITAHVNHAPVGTSGTVTTAKNTAYKFKAADFGFSDPNDNPPNTFLAVKITLLPNAGTLTDNGTAVTVGQSVSVADINAGKFVFTPSANLTGGPFFLCKFQVQDNGGTANGGVDLDPTPKILDVKIT